MTEYLIPILALIGAVCCWYAYRWGYDDGRNEGFEAGRAVRTPADDGAVTPDAAGGPGAVPR